LQLNVLPKGCYAEFGVFRGGSFTKVLKALDKPSEQLITMCYGFDSFVGFPPPKTKTEGVYREGTMSDTNYDDVCQHVASINAKTPYKLIKGFFEDSFKTIELEPISVCLVDCDSYTSSLSVLEYVKLYMQDEAVIVFDDYNLQDGCQKAAIDNFLETNENVKLTHIKDISTPEWTVPIYRWNARIRN